MHRRARHEALIETLEEKIHAGTITKEELLFLSGALVACVQGSHEREDAALELIFRYGMIEGDHHRCWVIDQVTRKLTGDEYEAFVAKRKNGEDGPNSYAWDEGIPP